jgi:hypothetical protein
MVGLREGYGRNGGRGVHGFRRRWGHAAASSLCRWPHHRPEHRSPDQRGNWFARVSGELHDLVILIPQDRDPGPDTRSRRAGSPRRTRPPRKGRARSAARDEKPRPGPLPAATAPPPRPAHGPAEARPGRGLLYGASVLLSRRLMPGQPSPVARAHYLCSADSRTKGCGSVCVSFTPVPDRSPVNTDCRSALVRDGRGRW